VTGGTAGARWKPLPGDLEPQVRELIVRLRELKDGLGLSLAALARKTAYSRSSWERYLNGATLPPRQAVERLGELAGADAARLGALWELAEHARGGRRTPDGAPGSGSAGTPDAPQPVAPRRRWLVPVVGVAATAIVSGVILLLVGVGRSPAPNRTTVRPAGYACHFSRQSGRLYAGQSSTSTRLVALNAGGPDVAEVQCLLKHHRCDPGRIDGLFGKHTERAVEQLQRAGGAVVDGIVGPQTWALLRR
jgi:transcriptional regulator with XRE-family HTH domain